MNITRAELLECLYRQLHRRNQFSGPCDKVYYLNKIMHSIDLFYAIELPSKWGGRTSIVLCYG